MECFYMHLIYLLYLMEYIREYRSPPVKKIYSQTYETNTGRAGGTNARRTRGADATNDTNAQLIQSAAD